MRRKTKSGKKAIFKDLLKAIEVVSDTAINENIEHGCIFEHLRICALTVSNAAMHACALEGEVVKKKPSNKKLKRVGKTIKVDKKLKDITIQ